MKEKRLITMSLLSLLLFNVGCSQIVDPKVKNNSEKMVKDDVTMDSGTQYRQRLQLLKKFKQNIHMPFIFNGEMKKGSCEVKHYDEDTKGYYDKDTNTICKQKEIQQEVAVSNSCQDGFGLMATQTVEITENNQTIKTLYQCENKNEKQTEPVIMHHSLEDERYISVLPITNQSGKKNLPTNFDLMIKNAINTIGQNYTLIEVTKKPKSGEYRIEGAITGLDAILNVNDNLGGQLYQTGGAKANLVGGINYNMDVKALSMDFIVKKYNGNLERWEYITNISTSNKILVKKSKKDNTFRFAFFGAGFQAGTIISKSNGLSQVSRALIESSLVELLAKLDDLPYWSFLPNRFRKYTFAESNWKEKLRENYREYLSDNYLKEYYKDNFVRELIENYFPNVNIASFKKKEGLKRLIRKYKNSFIDSNNEMNEDDLMSNFSSDDVDANLIVHLLERVPNKLVAEMTNLNANKPRENNKMIYKGVAK